MFLLINKEVNNLTYVMINVKTPIRNAELIRNKILL